jgi:hypothetical protein
MYAREPLHATGAHAERREPQVQNDWDREQSPAPPKLFPLRRGTWSNRVNDVLALAHLPFPLGLCATSCSLAHCRTGFHARQRRPDRSGATASHVGRREPSATHPRSIGVLPFRRLCAREGEHTIQRFCAALAATAGWNAYGGGDALNDIAETHGLCKWHGQAKGQPHDALLHGKSASLAPRYCLRRPDHIRSVVCSMIRK